jgi:hypothetical protein
MYESGSATKINVPIATIKASIPITRVLFIGFSLDWIIKV